VRLSWGTYKHVGKGSRVHVSGAKVVPATDIYGLHDLPRRHKLSTIFMLAGARPLPRAANSAESIIKRPRPVRLREVSSDYRDNHSSMIGGRSRHTVRTRGPRTAAM